MGLIQDLVDEVLPFPDSQRYDYRGRGLMLAYCNLGYAFLNLVFEALDCALLPYFLWQVWTENRGSIPFWMWPLLVLGAFSVCYSWWQCIYYFLKPVDKYIKAYDRFFGETAIGSFIAAIFNYPIQILLSNEK